MGGAGIDVSTAALRAPGFARVGQLVPDDQDLLTVPVGTKVGSALDVMRTHDYDQLPVVTVAQRVIGVFTYRSMAAGLPLLRNNALNATVEDHLEELRFVRSSQELGEVLAFVEQGNALLVGDEDRLLAIVTPADVSRFLWHRTRPFVLLQDIELGIRDLMRSACDASSLPGLIAASVPADPGRARSRLEDLTMAELLSVLLNGENFGRFFRLRFGNNRDLVRSTLDPVREIRNKVFHFRAEPSPEELETLAAALTWVRRRVMIRGGRSDRSAP
ncbi:CBS domain-containing protein [Micromonospora sp. CPCC 206060]|uniref:CBS domain-containing protein n=1 Tax=Micromonospora sp. CPCC 206060 TaxID=3122406 RepID=UPI002FF1D946